MLNSTISLRTPLAFSPRQYRTRFIGLFFLLTLVLFGIGGWQLTQQAILDGGVASQTQLNIPPQYANWHTSFTATHYTNGTLSQAGQLVQTPNPDLKFLFPDHYQDSFVVNTPEFSVSLRPVGANQAIAKSLDGKLVYQNVYRATDSWQMVNGIQTKEFLVLHDATAPQRFDYELTTNATTGVGLEDGALMIKGGQSNALQVAAPWLLDGQQRKLSDAGVIRWELGTSRPDPANSSQIIHSLSLVLNPTGLAYPLTVDPSWIYLPARLNIARWGHTATLLKNGRLLIIGGQSDNGQRIGKAEFFNGSQWILINNQMKLPRSFHGAVLLQDGRVLVVGGTTISAQANNTPEIFDPATSSWYFVANSNWPHSHTDLILLPNGKVFVSDATHPEIYDPPTNTWTSTAPMNAPHDGATATLLPNGEILVHGSQNYVEFPITTEIYNLSTNSWRVAANTSLRANHQAVQLKDGRVLMVGGSLNPDRSQIYNPANDSWSDIIPLNSNRNQSTATLLPDGRVIAIGSGGGQSYAVTTEIFDPATNSWTSSANLNEWRGGHTATILPDGRLLVVAGIGNGTLTSAEVYDPNGVNSTSIILTSSLNPVYPGQNVTFQAQISSRGGSAPGTITFYDGTTVLGTSTLSRGMASFTTSNLALGSHSIKAVYAGSQYFTTSTSPVVVVQFKPTNTQMQIIPASNAQNFCGYHEYDAKVTSSDNVEIAGTVSLREGQTVYASSDVRSYDNAHLSIPYKYLPIAAGPHYFVFDYSGFTGLSPLSVTYVYSINKGTVTSSQPQIEILPNSTQQPFPYGHTLFLYSNFSGFCSTPTTPVNVLENSTPISSLDFGAGSAALTNVSAGSHTVNLSFAGDSNYNPFTSPSTTFTVAKASTGITLTTGSNPVVVGQAVTLSAVVTSTAVTDYPKQPVIFKDGNNVIGTVVPNAQGQASFTTPFLTTGQHSLTASYTNDPNFTDSVSSAYSLTVNPIPSITVLDSLSNPALNGQTVTFTVAIRPTVELSVNVPHDGTVTLTEGNATLGSGTVDASGYANIGVSGLSAGSHVISATYTGGTNLLNSTSANLTQQMVDACSGLVVSVALDDGNGANCGTLSYVLQHHPTGGSTPITIGFGTPVVTLTTSLAPISGTVASPLIFNGGCRFDSGRGVPSTRIVGANLTEFGVGDNVTLKGLTFSGFSQSNLDLKGNNDVAICNWIGTTDGTTASGSASTGGLTISGTNAMLGLPGYAESGNLISGNAAGVTVSAGGSAKLYYNWVGLQKNGQDALPNTLGALKVLSGGQAQIEAGNRFRN